MSNQEQIDFLDTLSSLIKERQHQVQKHGGHDRPDGQGDGRLIPLLELVERICSHDTEAGTETWLEVLTEEFLECATEGDPARLEAELVQLGTVAAAWVTAIRRRRAAGAGMPSKAVPTSKAARPLKGLPSPYREAE